MNHPKIHFLVAVVFSPLLAACGQNDARIKALEAQVKQLETKAQALESAVQRLSINSFLKEFEGVAYLTPGSDGYSIVHSDLGVLTVSLANVQPYANGSKVTLKFGNLMAAKIDGLKAKLEWGTLNEKGLPIDEKTKSREVKFNAPLNSGSWTPADVVLEGVPPTELGFVRVLDVGHTGIALTR